MTPHRIVSGKKIAGPGSSPSTARDMDGLSVPTMNEALETTVMAGKHSFALQLRNQRHREEKDLLSSQNW